MCDLSPLSLSVATEVACPYIPTHLFLPAYCLPGHWRQSDWEMKRSGDERRRRSKEAKKKRNECLASVFTKQIKLFECFYFIFYFFSFREFFVLKWQ